MKIVKAKEALEIALAANELLKIEKGIVQAAEYGHCYIDFSTPKPQTLKTLRESGYTISEQDMGTVRICWQVPV
jgi:hypothetical protein